MFLWPQACIDDMTSQVDAYQASVLALKEKVIPMGGFWWQLLGHGTSLTWNPKVNRPHRPQKHVCSQPESVA